jgi:hypothetical protein
MPPHYTGPERRRARRREDDTIEHEIIERAIEDAPIVNRLLHAGRVAAACLGIGSILGAIAFALGIRITGPHDAQAQIRARVSVNAARIDSVAHAVDVLRATVSDMAFIQCVQVRRSDPDLTTDRCVAVTTRGVR